MDIPYFDLHCDTVSACADTGQGLRGNSLHVDLTRAMSGFKPYAQVFAIFGRPQISGGVPFVIDSSEPDAASDELYNTYTSLLDCMLSEFEENDDILELCLAGCDLERAAQQGKTAALISVEGAELLSCSAEHLKLAYDKGVRIVNMSWNYDNSLTGAAMGARKSGLSFEGRKFVKTASELGVVLDVSHISDAGFWDLAEISEKPFVASHSNSRKICSHPRNLTDDMFREIVRRGGLAGLNLCPLFIADDPGIDEAIAHIEYFCALGGEKNVCIGADLDGVDSLPHGISGVQDIAAIYEGLLRRNYSEDVVRGIFYNNAYSFFARSL